MTRRDAVIPAPRPRGRCRRCRPASTPRRLTGSRRNAAAAPTAPLRLRHRPDASLPQRKYYWRSLRPGRGASIRFIGAELRAGQPGRPDRPLSCFLVPSAHVGSLSPQPVLVLPSHLVGLTLASRRTLVTPATARCLFASARQRALMGEMMRGGADEAPIFRRRALRAAALPRMARGRFYLRAAPPIPMLAAKFAMARSRHAVGRRPTDNSLTRAASPSLRHGATLAFGAFPCADEPSRAISPGWQMMPRLRGRLHAPL